MFYGKLYDEGDNPVNSLNIYFVERDNMLSLGLQPLTTGSLLKIGLFSIRSYNCIYYTGIYFVVFCKIKHSSYKHLRVVSI